MRAVWLTDIHFDAASPSAVERLLRSVSRARPDVVLVGGDMAEADTVEDTLLRLRDGVGVPVCFVLGNHDFYNGSIAGVRAAVRALCAREKNLHWLSESGVHRLTERTALIGHEGWGDGRLGNYEESPVELNDFYLIDELGVGDPWELLAVLERLGDEAAAHVRSVLPGALDAFEKVVFLTHVPPFREAAWYEGELSSDDYLPFFVCKAVGDILMECMSNHPHRELTVLCGHTHGEGRARVLPNLEVMTGGARYGRPAIQTVLEIE